MTAIRESCGCGAHIRVDHSDPAPIAQQWRDTHPCDRRGTGEREVESGASAEIAYTEPHRTDAKVWAPLGFHGGGHLEPMPSPYGPTVLRGRIV